jgi:hypothetical protein
MSCALIPTQTLCVTPGNMCFLCNTQMEPSRDQVLDKVRQMWPGLDPMQVMAELDRYGEKPYETEVHHAVLN